VTRYRAIERDTVAGRYGDAVRVPEAVLEAAERVRSGRTTAATENRGLRAPKRPHEAARRRAEAVRGAQERLRRFRRTR
jgi:hypothetical protein